MSSSVGVCMADVPWIATAFYLWIMVRRWKRKVISRWSSVSWQMRLQRLLKNWNPSSLVGPNLFMAMVWEYVCASWAYFDVFGSAAASDSPPGASDVDGRYDCTSVSVTVTFQVNHLPFFFTESTSGRLVSFHRIWTDQLVPLQRECLLFPAHARPSRSSCDGELTDLCLLYTTVRGVLWRRSLLRMDTDVVHRCWHPAADQQRCVSCCRPNAVYMLRAAMRATSHRCVAPIIIIIINITQNVSH